MKFIRLLILAGVFLFSLMVSRSISMAIFHPYSLNPPEHTISNYTPYVTSVPIIEQVNILLIQTGKNLSSKPVGVWWIALAPETPITLVSLYPNASLETEEWVSEFKLVEGENQKKELAPDFITKLEEKNVPWDGYMILEPTAMEILIDSVGGIKIDGSIMEGRDVTGQFSTIAPNSLQGRAFHTDVWSRLCQKALFAGSSGIYDLVKDELSKHTILSPDFPVTFSDFQVLLNTSSLNRCEVNLVKTDSSLDLSKTITEDDINRRNNGN